MTLNPQQMENGVSCCDINFNFYDVDLIQSIIESWSYFFQAFSGIKTELFWHNWLDGDSATPQNDWKFMSSAKFVY